MASIASVVALMSVWLDRIRAALTMGAVGTEYLFREADQCPILPCSAQSLVLIYYCDCDVRIEKA